MVLRFTPGVFMENHYILNQFLHIYDEVDISTALNDKAEQLRINYNCFQMHYEDEKYLNNNGNNRWHRNGNVNKNNDNNSVPKIQRTDKIKIGNKDLSRESIARKDFLALMNKLSEQNKSAIQQTLKQVFREDCLDIYLQIMWDQMQRCSDFHHLHLSILKTIHSLITTPDLWAKKWIELWNKYISSSSWKPKLELLEDDDYDEFCDFVKWRKRAITAIQAWKLLAKYKWISNVESILIPKIFNDLMNAMICSPNGDKLMDVYLDELLCLIVDLNIDKHLPAYLQCLQNMLDNTDIDSLRPSTRFKMYDIKEKLDIKMKK